MKKYLYSFVAMLVCVMMAACDDKNEPANEPEPVVPPEPVEEDQHVNTWVINDGEEVKAESVLIYESADIVTVYFSAKEGLTSVQEFDNADDCTEISFPASLVGGDINLAALSEDDATYFVSLLPEFDGKYGFTIDCNNPTVTEGVISSSLENDEMTVRCEFITKDTDIKYSVYLCAAFNAETTELEGSEYNYEIKSANISKSGAFRRGFYYKNTWDDGWSFTYSVSALNSYSQLSDNTNIEISVGSDQLLNGEAFDVAQTDYPFSFKIEYFNISEGMNVIEMINNDNREGASGLITFKRNAKGLYDAQFDVALKSGDITVKGYYADALQPRNMIYEGGIGNVAMLRSATLDISSNPCVLYMSTKSGVAGPEQYDIKCEVPAEEWRFGKFMAFSGQGSNVTWIDGVCYDKNSSKTTPVKGGNWRVSNLMTISDGRYTADCSVMMFGSKNSFAYYYGEIKLIE